MMNPTAPEASADLRRFYLTAGERLKEARSRQGLNLDEVSKKTGCSAWHVRNVEAGADVLFLDTAADLCKLYGISLDSLVDRSVLDIRVGE